VYWPDRRAISVERSLQLSNQEMCDNVGEQDPIDIGPVPEDDPSDSDPDIPTPAPPPAPAPAPAPPPVPDLEIADDPPIVTGKHICKPSRKVCKNRDQAGPAFAASSFAAMAAGIRAEGLSCALEAVVADSIGNPCSLIEASPFSDYPGDPRLAQVAILGSDDFRPSFVQKLK
jgi:hypothetical protein